MRIIAVMSPKGGIGKTTTSDSIAYMLGEEQGKRVLVLDGDPQGDTSKTFGVFEPDGIGMSELLEKHECVGGTYKTGDLIRPTEYSHVDIIPANGYLMKTDMNLLLKSEDNQVTRLREALEEVADAYDYCICDCGRLLDMVVINILISAELIIAPVKVGGYEIEALQNLEEQIEDLRDINPDLRIKAPQMFPRTLFTIVVRCKCILHRAVFLEQVRQEINSDPHILIWVHEVGAVQPFHPVSVPFLIYLHISL